MPENNINKNSSNTKPPQSGRVMGRFMGGGPGAMSGGEKAKNFKGSFKKLLKYLSPFKIQIFIVILLSIASTIFMIRGPKILSRATNELQDGIMRMITGKGVINLGYIGRVILMLAGLYLISALFSYMQGHMMAGISTKVSYNLRNSIMKKVNRMPFNYFHHTSHGDVLSRITNDVDTLGHSLNTSITQAITSATSLIGVLIMMLSISWQLTLIALCIIPVSLVLVMGIVKMSQKYFKGQQKYLGAINGHVEEMYSGHLVVKAFNGEKKSIEEFDKQNNNLYNSAWKALFLSGLMMPIMMFIGNIGYVAVCIFGASFAAKGVLKIGDIMAFIQYIRSFTQPITQLANISTQIQSTVAAAERVFEFLDEEEEHIPVPKLTVNRTGGSDSDISVKITGKVRFKNVRFGYDPEKIIINSFSADVMAGKKIAIVGPTGAGKTTMVKLLMRFYNISGGAIYIDGHNIYDFRIEEMRKELGMVLQDTWLFNGTIMDNIRYGRLGASDEEVIEASKAAQSDHFIKTLPDSYKMILNEEASNVSQGQKQLLTIARAILADPSILILDEATSSVDTRTEILIQQAMDKLMQGRTSFIIAHRLSTIRNADLILCMDDGDIVEQGNHDELMQKDGFYANLYNSQFEKISES